MLCLRSRQETLHDSHESTIRLNVTWEICGEYELFCLKESSNNKQVIADSDKKSRCHCH